MAGTLWAVSLPLPDTETLPRYIYTPRENTSLLVPSSCSSYASPAMAVRVPPVTSRALFRVSLSILTPMEKQVSWLSTEPPRAVTWPPLTVKSPSTVMPEE